ncbi:phage tail protein [Brucella sp. 2280]|nr:phage tail protein [Brucella sp. 2280]
MIERHHHQPQNANRYERAMSESLDRGPELVPSIEALHAFKFNPPDRIVPYLIAEYGLTEIEDYLRDPREILRAGIQWQRIIGTSAALHKALGWINHDGDIEEFPVKARKWWWFQVHLPFEVRNTDFVTPMTKLVKASKPLRSEFARVTAGWDVRAFRLNTHRLNGGAYLNNWSGIRRAPGEPVLSLRVNNKVIVDASPEDIVVLDSQHILMVRTVDAQVPVSQTSARFASTAAIHVDYQNPATVPFQNAPFVHQPFGAPVPRVQKRIT